MRRFFLGLAANYSRDDVVSQLFSIGREEDRRDLKNYLVRKYNGEKVILVKNGRSALTLALMANFDKGDKILVNGFTCFAVYEAVKKAGLEPVFVDINLGDLNFDYEKLASLLREGAKPDDSRPFATTGASLATEPRNRPPLGTRTTRRVDGSEGAGREASDSRSTPNGMKIRGIIIQNTLGNPVNIEKIEKLAEEYGLTIIEDLAHSAGVKYTDGREAGTVGAATVLSFGKEKSIDTISGGAVIFCQPYKNPIKAPSKLPKLSDHLRARFYPLFGATARGLTKIHLGGILMRILVKIHWVEKSADSKLSLERKISKFEAKRALLQLKSLSRNGEKPLREFYFVRNRKEVLEKLKEAGYYFDGFWYEKPVSPSRYYKKVHFPENECKSAVFAAEHIVNLPRYYSKKALEPAKKIIQENLGRIK